MCSPATVQQTQRHLVSAWRCWYNRSVAKGLVITPRSSVMNLMNYLSSCATCFFRTGLSICTKLVMVIFYLEELMAERKLLF
jgi:hypothetical protein